MNSTNASAKRANSGRKGRYVLHMRILKTFLFILFWSSLANAATIPPDSWSESFSNEYNSNIIKLWSTKSFSGLTKDKLGSSLTSGWTSNISTDGYFIVLQLDPTISYNIDVDFTTWWNNPRKTVRLDWMEIQIDHSTGTVINHWEGGMKIKRNGIIESNQPFGKAGGDISAVPEPSICLMIVLGLLIVVYLNRYCTT